MAAPRLLVKYSIDSDRPPVSGKRRMTPALISGNVVPRSTEAGRMSAEAIVHLTTSTIPVPPSAGKTEPSAQPVTAIEDRVEGDGEEPDAQLRHGVAQEEVRDPPGEARDEPRRPAPCRP